MLARTTKLASAFLTDYGQRHKHPVNAALHLVGVPAVFYGLYLLCTRNFLFGSALITGGYYLQYLGHKAQGNEVGEITLIKKIATRIKGK